MTGLPDRGGNAAGAAGNRSWTVWLTYAAILAPLPYALSRLLWALGIPVGIDESALDDLGVPGWPSLYLLALVALSEAPGVVLYHLVLRGRRRLPARLPWLGGRRVPRLVAVAPMALAAVLLVAIGVPGAYQSIADFDALRARIDPALTGPDWALTAQMFHFAVWGLVLGSAVLAHLLRSRPRFHVLVQPK